MFGELSHWLPIPAGRSACSRIKLRAKRRS